MSMLDKIRGEAAKNLMLMLNKIRWGSGESHADVSRIKGEAVKNLMLMLDRIRWGSEEFNADVR